MAYSEDDFLMISGIQHFVFCRRQWVLGHIEDQWEDNYLTLKGDQLHEKADDPFLKESRGSKFIVRAMPIHSVEYGLTGICDIVEFTKDDVNGVPVRGKKEKYPPIPVEYKHGQKKSDHSDELQLLAEAVCLEEMLFCHLEYGYLYYGKTKHRTKVEFTPELRAMLVRTVNEMHQYWDRKYTPKVKPTEKCKSCSLRNICLPSLLKTETVDEYLRRRLDD